MVVSLAKLIFFHGFLFLEGESLFTERRLVVLGVVADEALLLRLERKDLVKMTKGREYETVSV